MFPSVLLPEGSKAKMDSARRANNLPAIEGTTITTSEMP